MIIGMRSVLDEIQVTNCQHEAGAQSLCDVDEQNHIAHEALFQRTGNSECYNGIDYGGKKDTDLYGTEWASQPRR